MIKEAYKKV